MKMVKKSLLGLVAVAALVLSLVGCGVKDDTEGIIKGTAGNYSVNYTSNKDSNDEYRAYKSTTYKHAGELAKITFKKEDIANAGTSKFGVIFGLKEKKQGSTNIRNFFIVGLGANGDYYVSKYENIVDIQAENFGASTSADATAGEAKETIISTGTSNGIHSSTLYGGNDEDKYAYIWYQVQKNGTIEVKIGNVNEQSNEFTEWKSKTDYDRVDQTPPFTDTINSYTISAEQSGYSAWTPDAQNHTKINAPQELVAIYARVQGTKTLNGTVKFVKDFCEAEDIEQID